MFIFLSALIKPHYVELGCVLTHNSVIVKYFCILFFAGCPPCYPSILSLHLTREAGDSSIHLPRQVG